MTDASRKLRRASNKMIAGVCAGIAEWLGWDVTVVRVLYVILTIISFGFGGIIAYIVLWIVMPRPES